MAPTRLTTPRQLPDPGRADRHQGAARNHATDDKLTAVDFKALPLQDAFTLVRGNGERKLAVFEDPNCGDCKRFEKDMQNVDNVTVYLFLTHPQPTRPEVAQHLVRQGPRGRAGRPDAARAHAAAAELRHGSAAAQPGVRRKHKITGTPTPTLPTARACP